MGVLSYFKTDVASKTGPIPKTHDNEKFARDQLQTAQTFAPLKGTLAAKNGSQQSLQNVSRPTSRSGSRANTEDDRLVDEIKHQVVLNHLFQHSCSSLWIRDVTRNLEGVMVRKRRNEYLYKPPALADSAFAQAMMALNVQVSLDIHTQPSGDVVFVVVGAATTPLVSALR